MDLDLRREYDTAAFTYPDLVKKESKISDFLLAVHNDPQKAAAKLANYWKARKSLFGDRWLLPMNQTGTGALSQDDVDILRSGFMVILPRPLGGYVTVRDESRLPRPPGISVVRILFYWYSNWPEMGRCDNNAVVHVITSGRRPPVDLGTNGWKTFFQALPINRAPKIYVVQAHEFGKKELIDFYGFQQVRNAQFKSRLHVEHLVGDSTQSTVALLAKHRIERHLMPRCLGGSYDYSRFDNWVRSRMTVEGSLALCPVRISFVSYNKPNETACARDRSRLIKQAQNRYKEDATRLRDACRAMRNYRKHIKKKNKELEDALAAARKLVASHKAAAST